MVSWLARPADRLVLDVGCGGGGMTLALAAALGPAVRVVGVDAEPAVLAAAQARVPTAEFVEADLDSDLADLRTRLGTPADLVWASASVHHANDQQLAVTALTGLLRPATAPVAPAKPPDDVQSGAGGRLALAEGGLPTRHLPWDLGIGEPGIELRLDTAQDRWFARMRAELPGSRPMPYGWTEALRRAGLVDVTTRTTLLERPAPLSDQERARVVELTAHRLERLRGTDLLADDDVATWQRLLDPDDMAWLGHRHDLQWIEARSVHIGTAP